MDRIEKQFLPECKVDIKILKDHILMDANKEDLLPTSLIDKYDVTLGALMQALRELIDEGFLLLTEKKWIRISENGKKEVKEVKEIEEENKYYIIDGTLSYVNSFFDRNSNVEINKPCLPSTEGLKKIMEGRGQLKTSNKK